MSKSDGLYIKRQYTDELMNVILSLSIIYVLSCTVPQALPRPSGHYSLMRSCFKGFENRERQQGGVCAVGHATLAQRLSRYVLYSIFMQSGVLWEEPELAVDSKRSRGSGNRDPVDTISHITLIFFGPRRVATSSFFFFFLNTPKQQDPIKHVCLCLTLILQRNNGVDAFLRTLEYL